MNTYKELFFFLVHLWAGSGTISFGYYVYKWGNRGTHPLNSGLEEDFGLIVSEVSLPPSLSSWELNSLEHSGCLHLCRGSASQRGRVQPRRDRRPVSSPVSLPRFIQLLSIHPFLPFALLRPPQAGFHPGAWKNSWESLSISSL